MVMMPSTAVSTMALSRTAASRTASSALFALGDVARDLGEAAEAVLLVEDRGDDAAGEEAAAVLAQVPPLVGRGAARRGGGDFPLGGTGVAVLRREEDGDLLAQDLGLGVAEEVLGAGVPTDDPPVGVDGENGEVLEALDHPPQVLLGLAQRLLDPLTLGDLVLELAAALLVARARIRDSASSRSVRTWSSTRVTIGSRWLRKLGVLGTKSRTPARSASTSRPSSCMPVTRIAGTLCPASLT